MFAHFRDMVESRGGSRWLNTNFAENAHVGACKTTYRAGNKHTATIQTQLASAFERRRVMHKHATELGVDQDAVRLISHSAGAREKSGGQHTSARAAASRLALCEVSPLRAALRRSESLAIKIRSKP
jgi:CO/xanthine dehydrogenase Mo-binding subunit